MRKGNLAHLLRGRAEGIFVAPVEQGEIGSDLFEAACRMGLEGLVSKHRESPVLTAVVASIVGSRSRTGSTPPSAASRISSEKIKRWNGRDVVALLVVAFMTATIVDSANLAPVPPGREAA
jgi:hypothetical protein